MLTIVLLCSLGLPIRIRHPARRRQPPQHLHPRCCSRRDLPHQRGAPLRIALAKRRGGIPQRPPQLGGPPSLRQRRGGATDPSDHHQRPTGALVYVVIMSTLVFQSSCSLKKKQKSSTSFHVRPCLSTFHPFQASPLMTMPSQYRGAHGAEGAGPYVPPAPLRGVPTGPTAPYASAKDISDGYFYASALAGGTNGHGYVPYIDHLHDLSVFRTDKLEGVTRTVCLRDENFQHF